MDNINEKVNEFMEENDISLNEMMSFLENEEMKMERERIIENIAANEVLVDKCFKGKCLFGGLRTINYKEDFYYKVVSSRSSRFGEVQCLIFRKNR